MGPPQGSGASRRTASGQACRRHLALSPRGTSSSALRLPARPWLPSGPVLMATVRSPRAPPRLRSCGGWACLAVAMSFHRQPPPGLALCPRAEQVRCCGPRWSRRGCRAGARHRGQGVRGPRDSDRERGQGSEPWFRVGSASACLSLPSWGRGRGVAHCGAQEPKRPRARRRVQVDQPRAWGRRRGRGLPAFRPRRARPAPWDTGLRVKA